MTRTVFLGPPSMPVFRICGLPVPKTTFCIYFVALDNQNCFYTFANRLLTAYAEPNKKTVLLSIDEKSSGTCIGAAASLTKYWRRCFWCVVDAVFINTWPAERSEHRHMSQKCARHQVIFILSSSRPSSQASLALVSFSRLLFEHQINALNEDVFGCMPV